MCGITGGFVFEPLRFPPSAAMELFESLGVPLKTERGRRVFPGDRAADVLAALRDYARDAEFVRGSAKSWSSRTASARVL